MTEYNKYFHSYIPIKNINSVIKNCVAIIGLQCEKTLPCCFQTTKVCSLVSAFVICYLENIAWCARRCFIILDRQTVAEQADLTLSHSPQV